MEPTDFPPIDPGGTRRWSMQNPASRHIKALILAMAADGRLTPGDPIPTESAMARHWRVNRATVNRTFKSLTNVLVSVDGVGWQVAPDVGPARWVAIVQRTGEGLFAVSGFADHAAADAWGRQAERESGGTVGYAYPAQLRSIDTFRKGTC